MASNRNRQFGRFRLTMGHELIESNMEVFRSLVGLLDFKSSGGYRNACGGFDSHTLPPKEITSLPLTGV